VLGSKFKLPLRRPAAPSLRGLSIGALRVAPWVVFGPITGVMSEAAIAAYKKGRPVVAGLYVAANVGILVSMPILTALIATRS